MATLVAVENQDLFQGLILSAAGLDVDPSAAGPITVSKQALYNLYVL